MSDKRCRERYEPLHQEDRAIKQHYAHVACTYMWQPSLWQEQRSQLLGAGFAREGFGHYVGSDRDL